MTNRVQFNANYYVYVRLTERGKRIYLQSYNFDDYPEWNQPDENGYIRFQLHELMRLFGPHIRMDIGGLPFDANLYFEATDLHHD